MDTSTSGSEVLHGLAALGLLQVLYYVCREAYEIRMYAINEYGRVIHEFDPYFNYRATEYLYAHGWQAFSTWFDHMVWYPLGRPVGTTIYPGMQVIAVWIKRYVLPNYSINDICVFIPTWFGVLATLAVAALTWCCTCATPSTSFRSFWSDFPVLRQIDALILQPLQKLLVTTLRQTTGGSTWGLAQPQNPLAPYVSAVAAAAIMSVVPAHIMRSIGGGYDNESIAVTAMVTTFAGWTATLRGGDAATWTTIGMAFLTGLAYFFMVAAWGGYVFVLNLIAVHAGVLVLVLGRYTEKLHRAYSIFYGVGTVLAIQVPVVGWTPLKSLEQLSALAAFMGLQLLELVRILDKRQQAVGRKKGGLLLPKWKLYAMVFGGAGLVALAVVALLAPTGYFGPISSRVRGLFVQHTKTGNPLVDSVAEHQAASPGAYFQYLSDVCYLAPVGLAFTVLAFWNDSSSFLAVYAVAAYYFSHRMVRLILLTGPIASVLGGICIGRFLVWGWDALRELLVMDMESSPPSKATTSMEDSSERSASSSTTSTTKKKKSKKSKASAAAASSNGTNSTTEPTKDGANATKRLLVNLLRVGFVVTVAYKCVPSVRAFYAMSHQMAKAMSHPTIIVKGKDREGNIVLVDDYRQAYLWLRDHTPEDARIMAWWDYGYQITGIANRTTLADGNTWNHEHIALLGRTLTAPEKDAHRIARHLADYVLVWSGGGGDDVAKSPHLRRIANSVYRGLCGEPMCRDFGFFSNRVPSEDLGNSLLYKLVNHKQVPGVEADKNRFREVYTSKHGKVRIFKIQSVSKESKEWVLQNRKCDAPGSWFCPGTYPPKLQTVLKEKKDFKQLEDFNTDGNDEEYQKQYFEHLNKKGSSPLKAPAIKDKLKRLSPTEIDLLNEDWGNTEITSLMYELISQNRYEDLKSVLSQKPQIAHVRSEDGRGPMFWAHEFGYESIIKILKAVGVSETRTDVNGRTPLQK